VLDCLDELVQMFMQPRVGKRMEVNRLHAERAESALRFGAAVSAFAAAPSSVGEDNRVNVRAASDELGERRSATKLEVVRMGTQGQNGLCPIHFGGCTLGA